MMMTTTNGVGNPSLDFIQRAAEALDVPVAELLGSQPKAARGKPGPDPQLQLRFEQTRRLPRKEEEFVTRSIEPEHLSIVSTPSDL